MRTEPVSIPAASLSPWAVLLLAGDRHRSVLSDLFSALRIDNRELTERGSVGSPANPTNRASASTRHLPCQRLDTTALIPLR